MAALKELKILEELRLLTEKQLSLLMGRSVSALRQDRARGIGVPYIKVGRLVRYRMSDIKEFLDTNLIRYE